MTEPYKKMGRGGAGNFYSKDDIATAAAITDTESQSPTNDLTKTPTSSLPPSEYIHSGRGGAGNWIKPSELPSAGPTQTTSPSANPILAKKIVAQANKPVYRGGRGGAGNYGDLEAEEKVRRERASEERRKVEERVERDVELGLSKPPKAYGGLAGAWEMGSMGEH